MGSALPSDATGCNPGASGAGRAHVGEVGRVGVRPQEDFRVSQVAVREVGGEVPKPAVVGLADEGDPPHELLGRFRRRRHTRHEREAVLLLPKGGRSVRCGVQSAWGRRSWRSGTRRAYDPPQPLPHALLRFHHLRVRHFGCRLGDLLTPLSGDPVLSTNKRGVSVPRVRQGRARERRARFARRRHLNDAPPHRLLPSRGHHRRLVCMLDQKGPREEAVISCLGPDRRPCAGNGWGNVSNAPGVASCREAMRTTYS